MEVCITMEVRFAHVHLEQTMHIPSPMCVCVMQQAHTHWGAWASTSESNGRHARTWYVQQVRKNVRGTLARAHTHEHAYRRVANTPNYFVLCAS
eukprot:GDKI01045506.1.p1 GENE.GDKI01045506.1~~GDKI01045506.1.p1  ORF type:complete len:107 (+),score=21.80 GDKI01045506.1:40-321(+)